MLYSNLPLFDFRNHCICDQYYKQAVFNDSLLTSIKFSAVERNNSSLIIKTNTGEEIEFSNKQDSDEETNVDHLVYGLITEMRSFLIVSNFYEWKKYAIVSWENGKMLSTDFNNYSLAPNNKTIVVFNDDNMLNT